MPDNSLKKLLTYLGIAVVFAVIAYAPAPEGLSAMGHFATPTVFFIFAMFCISIAFENSGLNRRIVCGRV